MVTGTYRDLSRPSPPRGRTDRPAVVALCRWLHGGAWPSTEIVIPQVRGGGGARGVRRTPGASSRSAWCFRILIVDQLRSRRRVVGRCCSPSVGRGSILVDPASRPRARSQIGLILLLLAAFGVEVVAGVIAAANLNDKASIAVIGNVLVASLLYCVARSWDLGGDRDTGISASIAALAGYERDLLGSQACPAHVPRDDYELLLLQVVWPGGSRRGRQFCRERQLRLGSGSFTGRGTALAGRRSPGRRPSPAGRRVRREARPVTVARRAALGSTSTRGLSARPQAEDVFPELPASLQEGLMFLKSGAWRAEPAPRAWRATRRRGALAKRGIHWREAGERGRPRPARTLASRCWPEGTGRVNRQEQVRSTASHRPGQVRRGGLATRLFRLGPAHCGIHRRRPKGPH